MLVSHRQGMSQSTAAELWGCWLTSHYYFYRGPWTTSLRRHFHSPMTLHLVRFYHQEILCQTLNKYFLLQYVWDIRILGKTWRLAPHGLAILKWCLLETLALYIILLNVEHFISHFMCRRRGKSVKWDFGKPPKPRSSWMSRWDFMGPWQGKCHSNVWHHCLLMAGGGAFDGLVGMIATINPVSRNGFYTGLISHF